MKQVTNYFGEVKNELAKVVWPKKEEVIKLTMVVFGVSVIVGAYLGGLDLIFTKLMEYIISQ